MSLKIGDVVEVVKLPINFGQINKSIHIGDLAEVCVDDLVCGNLGGYRGSVGVKFYKKIDAGHSCVYKSRKTRSYERGCENGYGWFISKSCVRKYEEDNDGLNVVVDINDLYDLL